MMTAAISAGPASAQTPGLTCEVGGTTVSVWPESNTYSRCDQSGVAHSIGATAGDGTLVLSNSENLVFEAPTEPFGHPALFAYAPPFHIESELRMEERVLPNGSTGLVPIKYTFFSMNQLNEDNLDLFSQPITITNSGTVTVTGTQGSAITARASTKGADVTNSGDISLTGDRMAGVFAMSGVARPSADKPDLAQGSQMFDFLGIAPGTYRPGGAISIANSGKIDIKGSYGTGLLARTLAGGITIRNTAAINIDGYNGAAIRAGAEENSIVITNSAALVLKGDGASGIDAYMFLPGSVTVTNNNAITLTGKEAIGINIMNADAGNDADGATTRVTGNGNITITGDESTGIDASNRVGGSLDIDYSGKISVEGTFAVGIHGSTDEGADVSVKANADVTAVGTSATGIAVSGFGEGVQNPDDSVTPLTHGDLKVEVGSGATVRGGSRGSSGGVLEQLAAGVAFVGGTTNTLINRGTVTADSGLAVIAVEGTQIIEDDETGESFDVAFRSGPLSVHNFGNIIGDIVSGGADDTIVNDDGSVISGNIKLGGGANSFENLANGTVNSGEVIDVGSDYTPPNFETNNTFLNFAVGNTFGNSGVLSPGGIGTIQHTTIMGNLIQSDIGGALLIDIDERALQKSDFITVTGAALLSGSVKPNAIFTNSVDSSSYKILTAERGVILDGATAPNTVGYNYGVELRDENDVYLTRSKIGLISQLAENNSSSSNNSGTADTISKFENSNSPDGQKIGNDLRNLPDGQALNDALERITPQTGDQQSSSTASGNTSFSNSMLSCASRDQPFRFTKEDTCYYAKFTARKLDRDATTSSAGHEETGYEFIGGAQVDLGGNLRGGFAAGYEKTSADTHSLAQGLGESEGDRVHAGFVLKDQWGPINAYLNIAGSYGWYDHTRFVNLGGFTNALGEQDVGSALVKLRLSYLHEMGDTYLKPLVDVSATYVNLGGYTETGADVYYLHVDSTGEWLFGVSPGIEFGGEIADASGTLYRPYIRGGVTIYDKDSMNFSANFASAPVGVTGFTVRSELDNVFADAAAGVQVLTMSGTNVKLEYEGRFGEHTMQNAGTVKVTMPY